MTPIKYVLLPLTLALGLGVLPARAHNPANGHPTTTTVTCTPNPVGVNAPAICTATVTDVIGGGQDAVPTGTVTFSSSGAGSFSAFTCTLAPAAGFSASCAVTYTPTATGTQTITATYPLTTDASHRFGTSFGTTTLTVLARPTVAKAFSPTQIATGGTSTLTITLSNSNSTAITGVAFTDTYPANLVNASAPAGSTTCAGGAVTAAAAGGSVALSGGTIPASGSCTVTVSVTSNTAGSYTNSIAVGAVTSTNAASNTAGASATLTVLARPTVTKSFGTNPIVTGASSALTITLSNSNAVAITGAAFTDIYPAGLTNSTTASTTCAGGTASAAIGGGTVSLAGGTIPAAGGCTVTVSVTSSTAGSYTNSIAIGDVTSTNAGSNTVAASATLTVNASVASFDAVEVGASPATNLYTKLSGVSFSLDVLALDSSNLVSGGYTGTVSLVLVDASTGGGVCASMTSLQALGSLTFVAADAGRKTTLPINYAGAARNAKIRIADAALGITSCSFDAFAVRPASLSITSNMTNTGTSGTPFLNAGGNFTLTATALAGYDGTPAIDSTKIAAHAGATQIGSIAGVFAAAVPATGVASGSTFTYSEVGNFQFLTQGVTDDAFTAVDQSGDCTNDFSNTLAGGKYGCKFGNTANTAFFGRFTPDNFTVSGASLTNRDDLVCSPASAFTYMNEPIGLAFTLTARNAAGSVTQNYTSASSFAKLDATLPASFNFVARDGVVASMRASTISAITKANPGQVTTTAAHNFVNGDQVYITGVSGMTQINGLAVTVTVVNATNFTIGLDTSGAGFSAYASGGTTSRLIALTSSGTWTAGSTTVAAAVRLERSPAPDGPFAALRVGIAPRDSDGISLLSGLLDLDADANASNDSFSVGTTELRFGRLRLNNAFGSSLLDLPLPLSTQYYDGNFFVTNTDDSCTTITANNIRMVAVGTPDLVASCITSLSPTGTIFFNAGKASSVAPPSAVNPPKLTKLSSGDHGTVDLTINLNGASGGNTCTPATTAVTSASKSWLQGNWGSGTYNDDPRGRATFGIFKNADQFLYLREVY
jgi:uncharacterized repeat protein (TIGR01451 family)